MLTHIVLLKPKDGATPEAVETLRQGLAALVEVIPGLATFAWGANVSPEGNGQGYHLGFVMEFESAAARDAYLPHPDHVAVGPLVRAVADDVLVFDLDR